ncbi:DUF2332 family protein [Sphingomonas sp.]|uniref:DUF2332 domain-containing protein n=1 Tax=Sphingomonas sp. TaxID=28214 RepID=UPI001B2D2EBF|nr:DUF2332 family protein [Sphingomonas sp.]MBO9711612.1 DUF2332 family protein [Sphingomonas sp.]
MNMIAHVTEFGELGRQARVARGLGSPFVADVLEAGQRQLRWAPRTAGFFAEWPDNPSSAALAMRFNAALHALARRNRPAALGALYRGEHRDFDGAIRTALADNDDFVLGWMRDTPQTNEVGRAAAIGSALMVVRARFGLPFELFELGSSCGLNLNLARYRYDLGGIAAGEARSPVLVAPEWRGELPHVAPIDVVSARGVDLHPLDPSDEQTRERLFAYVWADQPHRSERLAQALELALRYPPRIDRANAVSWLAERLAEPQAEGVCRTVFHSMVLQYLCDRDREVVKAKIRNAGARATAERPFAWIGFEWTPTRSEVRLTLTTWPDGESRVLALCHPYGNWVDWRG